MILSEAGCVVVVENHIHIGIIRNRPKYLRLEGMKVGYGYRPYSY